MPPVSAPIAGDGDDLVGFAEAVASDGHADRGGDRSGRRARPRKRRRGSPRAGGSRRGRPLAGSCRSGRGPAGHELVCIGLVADIPDEPVAGSLENVVKRQGQLDRAQRAGQVPPLVAVTRRIASRISSPTARRSSTLSPRRSRGSRMRSSHLGKGELAEGFKPNTPWSHKKPFSF